MSDITPIHNEGGPSGLGWSEIAAFFRCPKEYQYSQVRKIVEARTATPDYFATGSAMHAGRAAWLSRKCAMDSETDAFINSELERVFKEYEDKMFPVSAKAREDSRRYVAEYREHWSMREAPKTVAVEHMLGPFTLNDEDFHSRTARLDDFGFYPEAGGRLAIGECKTSSATVAGAINEYQLHGQPLLQVLMWRRAHQGAAQYGDIAGTVLDVIEKGYGGKKCKFARIFVPFEERVLTWYEASMRKALIQSRAIGYADTVDRNPASCTRASGKGRIACPYRNLCTWGYAAHGDYTRADGSPLTQEDCE